MKRRRGAKPKASVLNLLHTHSQRSDGEELRCVDRTRRRGMSCRGGRRGETTATRLCVRPGDGNSDVLTNKCSTCFRLKHVEMKTNAHGHVQLEAPSNFRHRSLVVSCFSLPDCGHSFQVTLQMHHGSRSFVAS